MGPLKDRNSFSWTDGKEEFEESMEYEVNRLASFDRWPKWAVKRPTELADKGFYYSGKEDQVKCYSCGGIIDNWSLDDDVETEHKNRFPNCPLFQNLPNDNKELGTGYLVCSNRMTVKSLDDPETYNLSLEFIDPGIEKNKSGASESIDEADELLKRMVSQKTTTENRKKDPHPKQHPQPIDTFDLNPDLLRYETYRRLTFDGKWPETSFTSPADLAKAGFYYFGPGDTVKCAFCKGRLLNWKATDNPMSEHRRHYPSCSFVKGNDVCSVSMESIEQEKSSLSGEQKKKQTACERLGVMVDKPKYPELAVEAVRKESFKHWPKNSVISPKELIKAGFFYVGHGDKVRCFFCGCGLQNWEKGDEPWAEHARWFPKCGFLKLNKVDNFAESVLMGASACAGGVGEAGSSFSTNDWLQRPDVKTVIAMGFSVDVIRKVIEDKLKTTGEGFTNVDSLLEAVLNEKVNAFTEVLETKQSGHRKKKNKNRKKKSQVSGVASPFLATKAGSKEGDNKEEVPGEAKHPSSPSSVEDEEINHLKEEYQHLKEERTCKICMDAENCVVFLPCGHIVCCSACAPALRNCPVCRTHIKGSVRALIP